MDQRHTIQIQFKYDSAKQSFEKFRNKKDYKSC